MKPRKFESDENLLSFLEDFCTFGPNRAYILLALARPKENEEISHGKIPIFREIITHEEKIRDKYAFLQSIADNYIPREGNNLDFRLYITANSRDVEKSFFSFQKSLTDFSKRMADGHEQTREKIKRLDEEWKSTLQTAGNKDDNMFIIDIDECDSSLFDTTLDWLANETTVLNATETPNGFHILTNPFNPKSFGTAVNEDEDSPIFGKDIELKTDGLTFLKML